MDEAEALETLQYFHEWKSWRMATNNTDLQVAVKTITSQLNHNITTLDNHGGLRWANAFCMYSGLSNSFQMKLNFYGPGCPVCVTSLELIDKAITLACMPESPDHLW